MAEARHHSIGEVLSMLKDEHADVTISKIRFFESQGLIDPERTPSGYRKFYDSDIDRLRWILVQQRDNFLPLKVIKRRLEEAGFDPATDLPAAEAAQGEPTLFSKRDDEPESASADAPEPQSAPEPKAEPEPAPKAKTSKASRKTKGTPASEPEPTAEPAPGPAPVEVPPAPAIAPGDPLDTPGGSVSLSALELAESAGVTLALVNDLDRLGLIQTVASGDTESYDHEALVVTRAAGVFMARGVEPRHLRMFKVSADRESGLLEQLVGARLRKGGDSQQMARAELNELVHLGETIHRSILRRSFGRQLD